MTNGWPDIQHADLILVMGGNAAEAHPCGFKWVTEAMEHRKAKFVVVDPRFTRSAAVADYYAPIRVGTDIAFLGGVINYLLSKNKIHEDYVRHYTNAPFLINADYSFKDGLFTGYEEEKRSYDKKTWTYQMGDDGFAKVDMTMKDPRCVYQLMKSHFSRYTPEKVSSICGTPKDQFIKVCEYIAETSRPDKVMTIMYALGWTQHSHGSQNIRTMAMIQMLLGNVGRPGGGVNALRGHANVQGITDMCAYSEVLSGYMVSPMESDDTRETYLKVRTPKATRPNSMNFPQNFPKWNTSLMKAYYGDNANKDNDFGYHYLPKRDAAYDTLANFERMVQGKMNGLICQGYNPLAALPNKAKLHKALSNLKYMVVIDPLKTESAEFWKNFGELNNVKPEDIKTEVIRLPSTCFAEDPGTFTSSGRVVHWHYAAADAPGEAKTDREIIGTLFTKLREMYRKDGGKGREPLMAIKWNYTNPSNPAPEELLKEISGRALVDIKDPKTGAVLFKAGEQLPGFGVLRDDGTTECGNWIYGGSWSQAGNLTARRNNADESGMGIHQQWGYSWPANRRILYNRANSDPTGKYWDAKRPTVEWDGTKWAGPDIPDIAPALPPATGPFIMNPEGVGRLFAPGMAEGPFPEHYEPFETPVGKNLMHPNNPKVTSNPCARVYKADASSFGKADEFPYAATTYRLTEHFHFWTKNVESNAITQPQPFIELGEALAKEKGIRNGDMVRVWSNRGQIKAVAAVTKRIRPLTVDGKTMHHVGIPIHFGFVGVAKNGFLANELTPFVGDANSQTPEFKAFLVNIAKV
ncbi:MAG: formate dehydrogenase-N subunit alpha [Betaproteobacteria bacterium]|jgi:formate dehydrogenase major subunit|nr:formate dehydrogenase-N subunit alpha [Betaproteobacteria bacterium]